MASILRPFALLSLALCALSSPVVNEHTSPNDPLHNGHELVARAACKDNLGRCFNPTGTRPTDSSARSSATAFCSSFLSIPVVTSIIGTTTPSTVITVISTVTASTEVQTSVVTLDVQATESSQTTVTTILSNVPDKRALSTAAPPKCGDGYSPAQYSSACACVSATPSTTYVTATAPVASDTTVNTLSITTTTVTVTTATITTGTTTVSATAVVTQTPSPPAPLCQDAANPFITNGKSYTLYCDQYYYGPDKITEATNVAYYSDCITLCSATPGCAYGYWVASNSRYGDKLYCYIYGSFQPSKLRAESGVDGFSLN